MEEFITKLIEHLPEIISVLTGAGVLSFLITKIRKWLEITSDRVLNFLNGLLTTAVVLIQAILNSSPDTLRAVGLRTALGFSLVQLTYIYAIKPASNLIADAKRARADAAGIIAAPPTTVTYSSTTSTPTGTVTAVLTPSVPSDSDVIAPVAPTDFPA